MIVIYIFKKISKKNFSFSSELTTSKRHKLSHSNTLFFFYKNVAFPAQAEYSYFSADFRLKIFLYYS